MINVTPPDLFLIEPPPEAAHRPVKPSHIVVGGDSASGGLALAFLQVVRDSGLPPPAGGVLVSVGAICTICSRVSCSIPTRYDAPPPLPLLTESPIRLDIIAETGLTIYKPSPLWPPPPNDFNQQVHELLRSSAQNVRGTVVTPPDNDDDGNGVAETLVTRPEDRETVVRVTSEDGTSMEIWHPIDQ